MITIHHSLPFSIRYISRNFAHARDDRENEKGKDKKSEISKEAQTIARQLDFYDASFPAPLGCGKSPSKTMYYPSPLPY